MKQMDLTGLKKSLYQPKPDSHKGMNGRLLVIGGSELFHASIFWSADIASRFLDLVHFTSPENENNDLVRFKLKQGFWSGIVVDYSKVEDYIKEDDCVLIGPGMDRVEDSEFSIHNSQFSNNFQIPNKINIPNTNPPAGGQNTREIVNYFLKKYPEKKWVVDGGALQEVQPELLNGNMIITPHQREWERLQTKFSNSNFQFSNNLQSSMIQFSKQHENLTILLKGQTDLVCRGDEIIEVNGGNVGMTKGGTGDVLAGLTAALYSKNDPLVAAQMASVVCKKAGEALGKEQGIYFSAGDLVNQIPKTLFGLISKYSIK